MFDFELTGGAAQTSDAPAFKDNFYKTAAAVKDEGNQLFKIKDYEAAAERYTVAAPTLAPRSLAQGQASCVRVPRLAEFSLRGSADRTLSSLRAVHVVRMQAGSRGA